MVSVMLEEDESGSATCWFKGDGHDDATISWLEGFASWHAGRSSTSDSVCSAVLIFHYDTEGLIFSRKKVMCFSDFSVYLHVSTKLFSPDLVFPHQVYF